MVLNRYFSKLVRRSWKYGSRYPLIYSWPGSIPEKISTDVIKAYPISKCRKIFRSLWLRCQYLNGYPNWTVGKRFLEKSIRKGHHLLPSWRLYNYMRCRVNYVQIPNNKKKENNFLQLQFESKLLSSSGLDYSCRVHFCCLWYKSHFLLKISTFLLFKIQGNISCWTVRSNKKILPFNRFPWQSNVS